MEIKTLKDMITSSPYTFKESEFLQEMEKKQKVKRNGLKISIWGKDKKAHSYLAQYEENNTKYIGIVNFGLVKDGFGLWEYPEGDKYFGMLSNDKLNKHGLYIFPSISDKETKKKSTEFYFGLFKNGKKNDHGVYLWLTEGIKAKMFGNFDKASFDCYVGKLKENKLEHGTYLIKDDDKYYVYHGGFSDTGRKSGNFCFFYCAENDSLLYGKVVEDVFIKGYYSTFNDEGILTSISYVNIQNKDAPIIKMENEIENKEEISKDMSDFRNIIMNEDYFGQIYELFGDTINYIDKKVNQKAFDSQDKFPELMQMSFEFNKAKIYSDVENVLKLYEKEEEFKTAENQN